MSKKSSGKGRKSGMGSKPGARDGKPGASMRGKGGVGSGPGSRGPGGSKRPVGSRGPGGFRQADSTINTLSLDLVRIA